MTKFFKRSLLSFFCIVNTFIFSDKIVFADQPNVIIIYTDDQGSFDLNCYGSKDLHTPHLDSLAAAGVRFTRMYSPSAICSASRAGLLTGRFPARAGVPGNVSSKKGVAGMPTEEITLAEHFMENGYKTGHVGKWHLGYTPETMPNSQGFESSFGHMGGCIDNYSHFFYWNGPNRHDLWQNGKEIFRDGEYFGELMIDQCRQFVSGNQSHPFFLYWAINWPHYPMQGTGKWREKYKDLPHPRNKYATFISTMDEMIGQLIKQLDDLGIRDNTIIVFQSDHGHSVEERAFYGGGNPGPFRGAKGSLFEGGLRVPSIISWPGELPENVTRDQTVCGIDWVPTLLNLAHCKQKNPERKLDGKDISLVIRKNEPTPHPFLYWQLGRGPSAQWAIIKDQWKILGNARDPRATNSLSSRDKKLFLIDLKKDISETTNLVDSEKTVTEQMTQLRASIAKGL